MFVWEAAMRVAVFVDGKNFYGGYKVAAPDRVVDFPKLASWLVGRAGGDFLWGVYYYTGIETGEAASSPEQRGLQKFLDMLELQAGFFVHRFPRKVKTTRCPCCQAVNRYTLEKEVDTTMVADMLRLAAVNAFDILVLVSGDQDHAPAIEGVRAVGKQAFVATWAGSGLSARSRRAAFDHIDLCQGVGEFTSLRRPSTEVEQGVGPLPGCEALAAAVPEPMPAISATPGAGLAESAVSSDEEFLRELRRAQAHFSTGYVGASYFVSKWNAAGLTSSADARRRILDRLRDSGRVELYTAPDGVKALRVKT